MADTTKQGSSRNKFGTFGGVFTPSILTILGVIMFMRANFVVGQAGVLGALSILILAKAITLLTSLSIGAISTNMRVRGGGSYFLISRVLGVEFGGAIGIALFLPWLFLCHSTSWDLPRRWCGPILSWFLIFSLSPSVLLLSCSL
jgi:hypothetical protein